MSSVQVLFQKPSNSWHCKIHFFLHICWQKAGRKENTALKNAMVRCLSSQARTEFERFLFWKLSLKENLFPCLKNQLLNEISCQSSSLLLLPMECGTWFYLMKNYYLHLAHVKSTSALGLPVKREGSPFQWKWYLLLKDEEKRKHHGFLMSFPHLLQISEWQDSCLGLKTLELDCGIMLGMIELGLLCSWSVCTLSLSLTISSPVKLPSWRPFRRTLEGCLCGLFSFGIAHGVIVTPKYYQLHERGQNV